MKAHWFPVLFFLIIAVVVVSEGTGYTYPPLWGAPSYNHPPDVRLVRYQTLI